jgi:transcription antitermination factor NusG
MQTDNINVTYTEADLVKQWYAVQTRYQHEQLTNQVLANKGFETFFPTFARIRQWKDRKKKISEALFPGYLFVADIAERRGQVVTTPGVCSIVCFANLPALIPNHEIESIRRAVSSAYPVEPHPSVKQGDRVRVNEGPLSGIEGVLIRKGSSTRLILSIEMLGRAAAVEIDRTCVERISPAAAMLDKTIGFSPNPHAQIVSY